jgi:Polyketide cyclase / dehydrase and lipid transport
MKRLERSAVIRCSNEEVWSFTFDPFNAPRARGTGFLAARWTPPGPPRLGSTFQARMLFFGLERPFQATITEWDPPHSVAFSVTQGPGIRSGSIRHTEEVIPEGTKVASVMELELSLVGKLLWPIVGPVVRRRYASTVQEEKRLLESGRAKPGGPIDAD